MTGGADSECVVVIAFTKVVADEICSDVVEFLGNGFTVMAKTVDEVREHRTTGPFRLFLASCSSVSERIRPFVPSNAKILVSSRYVNPRSLKAVSMLPPHTKSLIVSNLPETCEDAEMAFSDSGITHLQLLPYYPGAHGEFDGVEVAITCGLPELVPARIATIIDVGVLKLDVSVLIRLYCHLGLPIEHIEEVTAKYLRKIMQATQHYSALAAKTESLNIGLRLALGSVDIGIICVNHEQMITYANSVASTLLGDSVAEGEYLPEHVFQSSVLRNQEKANRIARVKDRSIYIEAQPVVNNGCYVGHMITLREVESLRKLELHVRKQLGARGHRSLYDFEDIHTRSEVMRRAIARGKQMSTSEATVLLLGETGTGKELFAHAIHANSRRKDGPFVSVNFAGLPESLAESELFGYEEGAFTGAKRTGKPGLFELADRGTIFLDEIGRCSKEIQAKTLRVLDEKRVRRLGSSEVVPIDVRIVAASNCDLQKLVEQGAFLPDLLYRLRVLYLEIPPLRERPEDVIYLLKQFLLSEGVEREICAEARAVLQNYSWPGNVRELKSVAQYISVTSVGPAILRKDLPPHVGTSGQAWCGFSSGLRVHQNGATREPMGWPPGEEAFVLAVMRILRDAYRKKVRLGRGQIVDLLKSLDEKHSCGCISEGRVRHLLAHLRDRGLLSQGRTRQGSILTADGHAESDRMLTD